jgi:hypothetical protein
MPCAPASLAARGGVKHQLRTVVNIPLFIGVQRSFWRYIGFGNLPPYHTFL